jgi:hypothetical protein
LALKTYFLVVDLLVALFDDYAIDSDVTPMQDFSGYRAGQAGAFT